MIFYYCIILILIFTTLAVQLEARRQSSRRVNMAVYHGVVATLLYIGILGLSNILDRVNPPLRVVYTYK